MAIDETVLDLIGAIYDAGLDAERWPVVLGHICNAVGGQNALFFAPDLSRHQVGFSTFHNIDPSTMLDYVDHFIQHDLWAQRELHTPIGQVTTGSKMVPTNILENSLIYNEFFRSLGIFHMLSVPLMRRNVSSIYIAFYRPQPLTDFDRNAQRLLSVLVPHLQRAAQMHWRIGALENRIAADAAIFDRLPQAVLLVDGEARVIFANHAGEALLKERDGIGVSQGRLSAATAPQTTALRQLIAGAGRTALGAGLDAGGVLALARPSMKRPLAAWVSPLRRNGFNLEGTEVAAVVFVADPEREAAPPSERLRALFGLTPAEARFAAALAAGTTPNEYSEQAGLSIHTVRGLLKQLLAKTDTKRQSDLVRLILTSSPILG